MTTASIAVGTLAANNTQEKIVGPFEWEPVINAYGHDCLMMIASATNDVSNVANFTGAEVIPEWRLVPNDNNVGQRNVYPVPGAGGIRGLMEGLHGYSFWVGNPNPPGPGQITVEATLPAVLAERGWRLSFPAIGADGIRLPYGAQQEVVLELHPGAAFDTADVEATEERDIVVAVYADGGLIGGMTYRLSPEIAAPTNPRDPRAPARDCSAAAHRLLECMDLSCDGVASVRVKHVTVDIELDRGCS
jgi:zinc metalloprotease ZmpB